MDGGHAKEQTPRYAQRTVACRAHEYANQEQDVIRQTFAAGNHTWLKHSLPVDLAPDSVHMLRRRRMERNRGIGWEAEPRTWSKLAQLWGNTFFQDAPHVVDEYDRFEASERQRRLKFTEMRQKVSPHDWKLSSQEKRLKHEGMNFGEPQCKETFPYLGGDKSTELSTMTPSFESMHPWLRSGDSSTFAAAASSTGSSFLAGRGGKALSDDSRGSRMILPTIVQRLQKRIDQDWEGTHVVVTATDQDLVQVAFHLGTVDAERGVLAYMHVLAKDTDLVGNLGLRKVSQLWAVHRDFTVVSNGAPSTSQESGDEQRRQNTWIFFLMAPKWVKMRPTDAFYTVHPDGSNFRMSAAGSSVLLSLGASEDQNNAGHKTRGQSSMLSSRKHSKNVGRPGLALIQEALFTMHGSDPAVSVGAS